MSASNSQWLSTRRRTTSVFVGEEIVRACDDHVVQDEARFDCCDGELDVVKFKATSSRPKNPESGLNDTEQSLNVLAERLLIL